MNSDSAPHASAVGAAGQAGSSPLAIRVDPRLNYGPMRLLLYEVEPGLTVASAILDGNLNGVYDLLHDMILIDRRLTYTRKRCTLVHELVHRAYGDAGHGRESRCRAVTARLLIDQEEYATAERTYDGDMWLMAEDLNVTPDVVADYRAWLNETILAHADATRRAGPVKYEASAVFVG